MEKLKIIIAGTGHRGHGCYGRLIQKYPDRAQVVAIAEKWKECREKVGDEYGIAPEYRFETVEEMLSRPRMADAALICTQDRQHVGHAVMALRQGYHVLMEKPISPDAEELKEIVRVARECNRHVVVCHVLRYSPFFQTIRKVIDSGEIGEVTAIQALESVQYWHQAHSFVRGNWRSEEETSPMILAKCCHDLDYLVWLSGQRCERVSSFGSLKLFRPECAPQGAAKRCTEGCLVKDSCPYDAEKIYLTNEKTGLLKGRTGWPCDVLTLNPTEESIRAALKDGPYGRCVYACDNDVVDHQVVNMLMENGATLTLTMSAFTNIGGRQITVMGTMGEIRGDMETNLVTVGEFGKKNRVIDVSLKDDSLAGHGGGDERMLLQFFDLLEGHPCGDGTLTTLETSVESHLIALAAEESRKNGGMAVEIAPMRG